MTSLLLRSGLFSGAFASLLLLVSGRVGFLVGWHGDFFGGEYQNIIKASNFWGDDEFENSQALLSG